MDHLREMETFIQVARGGSFTQASRQLDVSRSTVTKIVAGLEERLGQRLLIRSTHHISLTAAGELFAEEAGDILARVEHLHQSLADEHAEMSGTIRLSAPPSFAASHLVRAIGAFRDEHPELSFELLTDDGSLNLVKEGIDVAIRIAPILPDTALVARLLVQVPQHLVASPAYLERCGVPTTVAELKEHACLVHRVKSPGKSWRMGEAELVAVEGPLSSDLGEVLREAALAGTGLSIHPSYMVAEDIATGRLVEVLPEAAIDRMSVYAVYAERRFRPRRVLALLDFLKDWLGAQGDWRGVA